MEVEHIEHLFAFEYRKSERKDAPLCWVFDSWRYHLLFSHIYLYQSLYDPASEYTRLGMNQNGWYSLFNLLSLTLREIRDINKSYEFCSTYPSLFCVPSSITNAELFKVSQFRSKQRVRLFPLFSPTHTLF